MHSSMKVRSRAVILSKEKLLVVRHAQGQDFYALPGGHMDPGETPRECMRREIIEELGVEPEVGRLLYVYTYTNREGVPSVEFFFEITNGEAYCTLDLEQCSHAHELADVRWISPDEELKFLPPEFFEQFRKGEAIPQELLFLKGE